MRIAYIGPAKGTSLQRAKALIRLGHKLKHIDPWSWSGKPRMMEFWIYRGGGLWLDYLAHDRILREVVEHAPDLIWINQGEWFGPRVARSLRNVGVPLVNYTNDNPFGEKSGRRFRNYIAAIPDYDLHVVTFEENVEQLKARGAKNVIRVFLCADEVVHKSQTLNKADYQKYGSEVSYISQWYSERGPFIVQLIESGIPLSLWGDRWHKAPEWPLIAPIWKGPGIYDGDGFSKVIQCAKVSLCLLSKYNRNQHTDRSMIIPTLGTLLCAERTREHESLYTDGTEAVFFDNAEDCAQLCKEMLNDNTRRTEIAHRGYERALKNNLFNEPVMKWIIDVAMGRATSEDQRPFFTGAS